MSLDITLISEIPVLKKGTGVFIRINGSTKELETLEEVREHFQDADISHIREYEEEINEVFKANITHNLAMMAKEAGLYIPLWKPYFLFAPKDLGDDEKRESLVEEITPVRAKHLIEPLRKGLSKLKDDPDFFKKSNPENGWGTYEKLVETTEKYLDACYKYQNAIVEISI